MLVYGIELFNFFHFLRYDSLSSLFQKPENFNLIPVDSASEKDGSQNERKTESALELPNELLLEIPRLRIKLKARRGNTSKILSKNGWIRPKSAQNVLEGNTIIASHRLDPSQPLNKQFTYLPRVRVGENIFIVDDSYIYHFIADTVTIVNASAGWIEAETLYPRLTLYTCTPLWSSSKRLVITAILSDYYSKK